MSGEDLSPAVDPLGPVRAASAGRARAASPASSCWRWPPRSCRCVSARPTRATTRRAPPPARPTTCWPRASVPGFNGPFLVVAETHGPGGPRDPGAACSSDLAATPGVAFVSPPQPSPNGSAAILQLIPTASPQDKATSDLLKTVRKTRRPAARPPVPGVEVHVGGVTAIFEDFSTVLVRQAAAVHRGRRPAGLPPAGGGVPQRPRAADGGRDEPARRRCRLRRRRRGVPVGLARQRRRHRQDGPGRGLPAGDDVRDPVRPLDGLRGLPGLADPRGVADAPRQPAGRHPRAGGDRSGHHGRGRDHGAGLRELRAGRRADHQGVRHRPGRCRAARRADRPDDPGAGGDAPVRPGQLVAAGLDGPRAAAAARRGRPRPRTSSRPPSSASRELEPTEGS